MHFYDATLRKHVWNGRSLWRPVYRLLTGETYIRIHATVPTLTTAGLCIFVGLSDQTHASDSGTFQQQALGKPEESPHLTKSVATPPPSPTDLLHHLSPAVKRSNPNSKKGPDHGVAYAQPTDYEGRSTIPKPGRSGVASDRLWLLTSLRHR